MTYQNSLLGQRRPALIPAGVQLSPADELSLQRRIKPLADIGLSSTTQTETQQFDFYFRKQAAIDSKKRKASVAAEQYRMNQQEPVWKDKDPPNNTTSCHLKNRLFPNTRHVIWQNDEPPSFSISLDRESHHYSIQYVSRMHSQRFQGPSYHWAWDRSCCNTSQVFMRALVASRHRHRANNEI